MSVAVIALGVIVALSLRSRWLGDGPHSPLDAGARGHLDIAYAHHDIRNRLDVYVPAQGDGPWPTVVWIHPGGWRVGDKAQWIPIWDWTNRGYAVVSINYRFAAAPHTVGQSVDDARAAIAFVFDHHADWNLDPQRIGVFGLSAGGHLASMVAASEPRVAAMAMAGSPTDFAPLLDQRDSFFDGLSGVDVAEAARELLGCKEDDGLRCAELATAASPAQLDGGTAPRLVIHGTDDDVVSVAHARRYVDSLDPAIEVELVLVAGGGHEVDVDRDGVTEFFDQYLRGG